MQEDLDRLLHPPLPSVTGIYISIFTHSYNHTFIHSYMHTYLLIHACVRACMDACKALCIEDRAVLIEESFIFGENIDLSN